MGSLRNNWKYFAFVGVTGVILLFSYYMPTTGKYGPKHSLAPPTEKAHVWMTSTKWLVFKWTPHRCPRILERYADWNIIAYDVYGEIHGVNFNSHTSSCQFKKLDPQLPETREYNRSAKEKAFLVAIKNNAAIIQTATLPQEDLIYERDVDKPLQYVKYETISEVLDHFSCSQNRSTINNRKLTKNSFPALRSTLYIDPASETTSNSYIPKQLYSSTTCDNGEEILPVAITNIEKKFISIDFDNAIFYSSAFWTLPVVGFSPCEQWVWTKVVSMILQYGNTPVIFSKALYKRPKVNFRSGHYRDFKEVDDFVKALPHQGNENMSAMQMASQVLGLRIIKEYLPPSKLIPILNWINTMNIAADIEFHDEKKFPIEFQNEKVIRELYNDICANNIKVNISIPWIQFKSTILVAVFNHEKTMDWIPYFEMLYRPFFPHIFYCVPTHTSYTYAIFKTEGWNVSIIYYDANGESMGEGSSYMCLRQLQKLNLNTKGYLFLPDDMIYSVHAFFKLPKWKPATCFEFPKTCDLEHPDALYCPQWIHFGEHGRRIEEIKERLRKEQPKSNDANRCFQRMHDITGPKKAVPRGSADLWYLPATQIDKAVLMFDLFFEKRVFFEVAVGYVLACTSNDLPTHFKGRSAGSDKEFYKWAPQFVSEQIEYIHLSKLSYVMKGSRPFVQSICKEIIPYFYFHKVF